VIDYYNALDYPQSRVLIQQQSCYELSLVSLSLPNELVESVYGNILAFYNYVYVQLTPIQSGFLGQTFISNNPNARGMLFCVPITNINSPTRAAFVQLQGVMENTIRFNPLQGFHFAVYLSNGDLLEFRDDTPSPQPPTFDLQVSAVFQYKRL